ncbi:hypothetical protein NsoK4_08945 [Nitrosopumilus sp. K4]|uniref:hypothetical protein n=1 Tax=Nitrosopumilus sp. K4 TaxID=2795383 RepID=UPI001BAD6A25|nr:hypothetical protein [Nitrosopumilus sp. K4]QUC64534.1 hypothetical protein NsoK4_08945 [Nitrosopumilus sp. K4]
MKYLITLILFSGFLIFPAFAQEETNPSLVIDTIEIPGEEFNKIARDAAVIQMEKTHEVSWQATIDNNLIYANPDGNAVLKIYEKEDPERFVEIGMGSQPNHKFWVAVKTPKEGYVVVHRNLERGWFSEAKIIVSYTERAGLTVNNGARIVVSNLDIGKFAFDSYSVHGMESSSDPPAVNSGSMTVEFLSGDPSKNVFALFPFYVAAGIGVLVGVLFLTKKRS